MGNNKRNLSVFFLGLIIPWTFLFLFASLAFAHNMAARLSLHDHHQYITVQLELSKKTKICMFTLSNPDRLVLDFFSNAVDISIKKLIPNITNYHHALFKKGVTRLVLHINTHVLFKDLCIDQKRFIINIKKYYVQHSDKNRFSNHYPSHYSFTIQHRSTKPIIVIDPGHGGVDPGAIGINRIYEKTANLEEARVLKRVLVSTGKYRVALTRSRDIFIPLIRRYHIAEELGADLFISLHADQSYDLYEKGATIYTLSTRASDRIAAQEAARENSADFVIGSKRKGKGYDKIVNKVLFDFEQTDTMKRSWVFAQLLVSQLHGYTSLTSVPHRYAGFVVLRSPKVPSILLEMGFISNPKDNLEMFSHKHQLLLAKHILRAINKYFSEIR